MIDCMYNKCMYRTFEGEKTECKCFSVKNNGLKRYLEMCYSVSCKKNSIQRPSILYEREKIIQYFQTCRFLWRYAWIFFIIHCIIHTGITTWKLVFGVYNIIIVLVLYLWPKNMLWVNRWVQFIISSVYLYITFCSSLIWKKHIHVNTVPVYEFPDIKGRWNGERKILQ